ncbi:MAG TPA: MMPL family transporter [Mycobacteriales bacterium]|nr:MMPL family transporter [Mycobacteriales bacterium]
MLTRLGGFLVRRARLVLVAAAVLSVLAAVVGIRAFGELKTEGQTDPHSDSERAHALIDKKFGGSQDLVLLVQPRSGTVDSPAVAAAAKQLTASLRHEPHVDQVVSYWSTPSPQLRAEDGRSGLVLAHAGDDEDRVADLIDKYATAGPVITVRAGGDAGFNAVITDQVSRSLALAESIAVPVTLLLLLLVFGSLVAAVVPLIIGAIAILGTFAELFVLGSITDVSIFAVNLTTALGLALGIDYGLLVVSRFRERLGAGDDVSDAVRRTVATAGRTILFSASTVAVALSALLIFPQYFLRSFAYAGIGVVIIAAVAGVVVTPALLVVLGRRVDKGRLPWARPDRGGYAPVWGRLAGFVMRRPALTAVPVLAILLIAASPLLKVHFGTPDDRVLRTDVAARQVGDVLRADYASDNSRSLDVVLTGAIDRADLSAYATRISDLPAVSSVVSSGGAFAGGHRAAPGDPGLARPDAQRLTVRTALDPQSGAAGDLVHRIRDLPAPGTDRALVTGNAAVLVDSTHAIASRLPIAIGMIVLTTFVLLFLFTGSIVQPLRALLLNGLSLSATMGIVVWVFQEGHLSGLLNFTPTATDTSMTVLLFCIAFGLSMDYEVFVTSRIKELHDAGADVSESVTQGLAHTGRIVSAAGALLAVSFFAFLVSSVSFLQLFGLGAGLAILIDSTLVRGILVPAFMRVVGAVSWYAPRGLRRVYARLAISES